MLTETLYLVGAGGHCRIVLDALLCANFRKELFRITDDNMVLSGASVLGFRVDTPAIFPEMEGKPIHVCIGDSSRREAMSAHLVGLRCSPYTVIHPAAIVSPFAAIGLGTFVAAGAIIGPAARIGPGVIVNHGAVVDHDCVVGAFSHIAPNATLGGNAQLGERVLIGAGARILPELRVGNDARIGAAALVRKDVATKETWAGAPAIRLARR